MKTFLTALGIAMAAVGVSHAADPLYPPTSEGAKHIDLAMDIAKKTGKRVIVDFGGNWCGDCKVLDINLKKPENAAVLEKSFVLVHVNVGEAGITDNFALAERYGIPLKKGVPALAVLEPDGKLVYAQKNGEFESMRKMDPKSVNEFLVQWRK